MATEESLFSDEIAPSCSLETSCATFQSAVNCRVYYIQVVLSQLEITYRLDLESFRRCTKERVNEAAVICQVILDLGTF